MITLYVPIHAPEMNAMTTVYFIRHCESDTRIHDPQTHPLTSKGLADRRAVEDFLANKDIDAVLSSPFKRAYDTVASFAEQAGLAVEVVDDFRERKSDSDWARETDFLGLIERQWKDFDYTQSDGESLATVQRRNIAALNKMLKRYAGRNIAIGTHGTALSTIVRYYDSTYGFDDFMRIAKVMPWVVKMVFEGKRCLSIEKMDILQGEV